LPEEKVAEEAVEEAHIEEKPEEAPAPVEEAPAPTPTEEVKIPNIFMVGDFDRARALVVLDEGKAYPMDDLADRFVREHNIPIFPEYPQGVNVTGSDRAADLNVLAKKLEAQI